MKHEFQHLGDNHNKLFSSGEEITLLLSGNEAYTRGLIEAQTGFVANYPGTPTSEIGDFWKEFAVSSPLRKYQLAPNETVAFEAAVGAAWTGIRAAVCFKHLGMNLISDALHTVMYSGVLRKPEAGLLIICGGDPDIKSSTNAQDVRLFSLHTHLPILEPSCSQECKDFVPLAFELSEHWGIPVMIYSPAQINHGSGIVKLGKWNEKSLESRWKQRGFHKNFEQYNNAIHWAKHNQAKLFSTIHQIMEDYTEDSLDILYPYEEDVDQLQIKVNMIDLEREEEKRILFITDGICARYLEEIFQQLGWSYPHIQTKLSYPIKIPKLMELLREVNPEFVVVIEEQEPFIEIQIKNILFDMEESPIVVGKNVFPRIGTLNPEIIADHLSKPMVIRDTTFYFPDFKNILKIVPHALMHLGENLPIREPTFCPGCSHRNVYYAIQKAAEQFQKETGKEPIFGGDIGCYTMGMSSPYNSIDWLIAMGAGLGIANGVAATLNQDQQHLIAFIGDSTFFHTGIQALINLIQNNLNCTVVILDNFITAMTGHQVSPSTPSNLLQQNPIGENVQHHINISKFIQGMDYRGEIRIMDGYNIPKMTKGFFAEFSKPELKIVIVQAECALNKRHRIKELQVKHDKEYREIIQIQEFCSKCDECYEKLGCTAIEYGDMVYHIDEARCFGEHCGSCLDICPNHAIHKTILNPHLKLKLSTQEEEFDE